MFREREAVFGDGPTARCSDKRDIAFTVYCIGVLRIDNLYCVCVLIVYTTLSLEKCPS